MTEFHQPNLSLSSAEGPAGGEKSKELPCQFSLLPPPGQHPVSPLTLSFFWGAQVQTH